MECSSIYSNKRKILIYKLIYYHSIDSDFEFNNLVKFNDFTRTF